MINSEKKRPLVAFSSSPQNLFSKVEYLENYVFNLFVVFSTLIFLSPFFERFFLSQAKEDLTGQSERLSKVLILFFS